jgi:WXG100 family type VII secretion target
MSSLQLRYAALSAASGTISSVFDELTGAGQTLDGRATAFLGSGWQGQAAEAFRTGYDEWSAGAREVLAALVEMGVLIDQANQRFAGTDVGVDTAMQNLHARLGGTA